MRITFMLPVPDLSGGVRVVGIYAQKLKRKGHDVTIVTQAMPKLGLRARLKMFLNGEFSRALGGKQESYIEKIPVRKITISNESPRIDEEIPDADLIVGTWWETMETIMRLPPSKGVPLHFVQHYEAYAGRKERVDAVLRIKCPKVCVSEWLKEMLEKDFLAEDVTYVPNTVDFDIFNAPPRDKNENLVVGMCYRDIPYKGTDIMLKAFSIAKSNAPNIVLHAFGDTRVTKDYPLPKGARYWKRPPQDLLKRIYSSCDVWLFGSRAEGFGLPIIEAMACRTPVIGTPAGVAPEKLRTGGGILVPFEDPNAMADAILRVERMDNSEWKRMSEAAYNSVKGYTWDDAADKFEKTLLKALGRKIEVQ